MGFFANTGVVLIVITAGTLSFHWSNKSTDTECLDNAYYLSNYTAAVFLACTELLSRSMVGIVSIPVNAGHVFGWNVGLIDGIFAPGVLTITNFRIPASCVLFLLGLARSTRARRRHG